MYVCEWNWQQHLFLCLLDGSLIDFYLTLLWEKITKQTCQSYSYLMCQKIAFYCWVVMMWVLCISVRPKGFFLFQPKLKLTETAIFHFGRNRYRNRKYISVSAETDTETEINFHSFFSNFWSDLFQESRISYKNIFKSYKICFLRLFWYDFCRKYNFLEKYHSRNGWKNSENVFRLLTETEVLFRPIPKPKVVLQFRQNRNSAESQNRICFGRTLAFYTHTHVIDKVNNELSWEKTHQNVWWSVINGPGLHYLLFTIW